MDTDKGTDSQNIQSGAEKKEDSIHEDQKMDHPTPSPQEKMSFGRKFLIFIVILVGLCIVYANWEGKFNRWSRWTEEVELSNGETVWVNRSTSYYGWSSVNSGGTMNRVNSISFKSPLNLPEWSADVAIPMLLDFNEQTQRWFIVATFSMCAEWKDWGNPMPPYRLYELHDGEWQLVPFDDQLIGRQGNLLIHEPNSLLIRQEVTAQERRRTDHNVGEKYKRVVDDWDNCGMQWRI